MHKQKKSLILAILAGLALSSTAQAALQGRDLNGSIDSFEAYYDTELNITWLDGYYHPTGLSGGYDAGPNYWDGLTTWSLATDWAADLSITDSVNNITYDNWRLPAANPVNGSSYLFNSSLNYTGNYDEGFNITSPNSELAHLFYVTLGNPGYKNTDGTLTGCYVAGSSTCLDNTGPFMHLQATGYWSGSYAGFKDGMDTPYAFFMYMQTGLQTFDLATRSFRAMAVADGDIGIGVAASVPEPESYALMLAGLALVGTYARRHARNAHR